MDHSQDKASPLKILEAQVNIVLEHTGRLFANNARNHGVVNNPIRLKQVVVGANNTFHDSLDELEAELTLARAVMRRDLAIYRAKRGVWPKVQSTEMNGTTPATKDKDIVMGDFSHEQSPSPPKEEQAPSPIFKPEREAPEPLEKLNSPLQLEIPGQEHQASGHAADATTGTYSNFDFESLFNDPSSAGGASRESPKEQPAEPVAEPKKETESPTKPEPYNESNNDFDFADLTNFGPDTDMQDTDGISSLLPGLESYANSGNTSDPPPTTTQPDFNIFDAAGANDFGNEAPKPVTEKQQQQGPPDAGVDNRDDTFDDIMNFSNFELGEFGSGEGAESEEHRFDASFFDI